MKNLFYVEVSISALRLRTSSAMDIEIHFDSIKLNSAFNCVQLYLSPSIRAFASIPLERFVKVDREALSKLSPFTSYNISSLLTHYCQCGKRLKWFS